MTDLYRPSFGTDAFGVVRASMAKAENGSYVRLVDYEKLKAERDALQRQIDDLTGHVRVDQP